MSNAAEAAMRKDVAEFIRILKENPQAVHEEYGGLPCMFLAAKSGDLAMVKYVAEYSMASLNTVDREKRTMLHWAVESGSLPVVKYLVERGGMSPLDGDQTCVTPFDLAVGLGYEDIICYFEAEIGCRYKDMYHNPVRQGMFPDPSVVRVGEDYYMVNSTFIFFPCIPISHSKDLIHWEIIGHAITNPEWARLDSLEGGRGYWAPDISYDRGRFFITATYRCNDRNNEGIFRRQMVTSSDRPEGPYCEPSWIDVDGIDPSIFTDDDGRKYMLLNRGAKLLELSADGTRQLSEPVMLYYGDQKRAPEGPHLLKKDGWYYLFLAEGGTGMGHRVTVARSKTLMGRYEPCPYNPILRQWNENAPIQRAGHGKPVQTQNGDWYMFYLCGRCIDGRYSILGRETALDPIEWTADGWPVVNGLNGPSVLQKKPVVGEPPFMEPALWEEEKEAYAANGFGRAVPGGEWMTPRPPQAGSIRLEDGILYLTGDRKELYDTACRSVAVKRQTRFCFSAETSMAVSMPQGGENAGLTCYYDENTYLKFGVFGCESESAVIKLVEHIGDQEAESGVWQIDLEKCRDGVVRLDLRVDTWYLKRCFWYRFSGEQAWRRAAELCNVNYLCDEGLSKGKRFTGAMVGLYAVSGKAGRRLTAEFGRFAVTELEPLPSYSEDGGSQPPSTSFLEK